MTARTVVGGEAVFPGPGSKGRGERGQCSPHSVSASALQPTPLPFPGRCPAPSSLTPVLTPGTQVLRQKTSIILDAPRGIAPVSPFHRKGEISCRRDSSQASHNFMERWASWRLDPGIPLVPAQPSPQN